MSSIWRELKAVYLVLLSFANKIAGHVIKWFTDNRGVVHIVRAGSRKQHLQDGNMAIFELRFTHSIKLEIEWIPRSQNECADSISRIVDYDDWGINPYLTLGACAKGYSSCFVCVSVCVCVCLCG